MSGAWETAFGSSIVFSWSENQLFWPFSIKDYRNASDPHVYGEPAVALHT